MDRKTLRDEKTCCFMAGSFSAFVFRRLDELRKARMMFREELQSSTKKIMDVPEKLSAKCGFFTPFRGERLFHAGTTCAIELADDEHWVRSI